MSEIYWLTRLDAIFAVFLILCILAGVVTILTLAISLSDSCDIYKDDECAVSMRKICKKACLVFGISLLVTVFCPTKKDMLAIWGIGGTIDYIKSNDKVKELPDKVIDALDRYIDSIAGDDRN